MAMQAALLPPGAKVVDRDGRSVTAHYGSVATELAVCRKSVGLAVRTELRILGVCGREPWLERLLSRALTGRVPAMGTAAVAAGPGGPGGRRRPGAGRRSPRRGGG